VNASRQRPKPGGGAALALLAWLLAGCGGPVLPGVVRDEQSGAAVRGATVFHNGRVTQTDGRGRFALARPDRAQPVFVRANGYRPAAAQLLAGQPPTVRLERFTARGMYLSHAALGLPEVRARALRWVDGQRLNTLVLDLKDEHGRMSFYNGAPEAGRMGAFGAVRFADFAGFVHELRRKAVYVVGRIAVFQDAVLAKHKPEWRPKSKGPGHLFWLDPFRQEVWAYNLAVAREAAAAGCEEIQFDHVRFPGEWELPGARFAGRNTEGNRRRCLRKFLARARVELRPFPVGVSVGPHGWAGHGGAAGETVQWWRPLTPPADGFAVEVRSVEEVAWLARQLAGQPARARVWLGYAGEGAEIPRAHGAEWFRALVDACETARLGGWVLYDPRGRYAYSAEMVPGLCAGDAP